MNPTMGHDILLSLEDQGRLLCDLMLQSLPVESCLMASGLSPNVCSEWTNTRNGCILLTGLT
jgi:hypothetical protein